MDRFQQFARRYRYVLRLDIVKHFPSIDHKVLLDEIGQAPLDRELFALCTTIVSNGCGILDDESDSGYFPGDDLLSTLRPRGLPIGNLTSQFWSNVYLNPLDQFIKRELRCSAYLRYVDDMALFSDDKSELWEWKQAIVERLWRLRLRVHDSSAQVVPVNSGTPWREYNTGRVSFAELDAVVQGWVNYLRYADTWKLRQRLFQDLLL